MKGMELDLVVLLRVAWVAAILPMCIASIPSAKLSSFHEFVLAISNRGKTMKSSQRFTVPQRFFCHFYVLGAVWTAVLLLTTWTYASKMAPLVSEPYRFSELASDLAVGPLIFSFDKSRPIPPEHRYKVWRAVFLLSLMEVHILRRLFETLFVFKYSPKARMHPFCYLGGLGFYAAAPLSLCCNFLPEVLRFTVNKAAEFIVKSKSEVTVIEFDWWESANSLVKLGSLQLIGGAMFIWGWIHQRRCHTILGSLRANAEKINEYVIPHGDWFEIVSSPHYLAEIVLYAGLLVASGGDLTVWLLFVFVVGNLLFSAAETHKWCLCKFDNYPKRRLAIIPFIY